MGRARSRESAEGIHPQRKPRQGSNPPGLRERQGLVSLLYVVSYLGLGVPAVLAGFGVVHGGGLASTARYYGAAVIALAALALFGLLKNRPGRAAEPAAAPAQGIR